jgi:hypothetical protein
MQVRDRVTELLVETLARALALPGEHRLFRSGKLDGLFPSRGGVSGESAQRAMRDGLLERTRTETKGKTEIEWVRIAPRGVEFLHEHESPTSALHALRATLRSNHDAIPIWLDDMRKILQQAESRLAADAAVWQQRLLALEQRVGDTLRRLEAAGPLVPAEVLEAHPWAIDALNHLDRRRQCGAPDDCSLPELFDAVAGHHPTLQLADFHAGLRRLHQRRALRLRPAKAPEEISRPEFALIDLDEMGVCYYAVR